MLHFQLLLAYFGKLTGAALQNGLQLADLTDLELVALLEGLYLSLKGVELFIVLVFVGLDTCFL